MDTEEFEQVLARIEQLPTIEAQFLALRDEISRNSKELEELELAAALIPTHDDDPIQV